MGAAAAHRSGCGGDGSGHRPALRVGAAFPTSSVQVNESREPTVLRRDGFSRCGVVGGVRLLGCMSVICDRLCDRLYAGTISPIYSTPLPIQFEFTYRQALCFARGSLVTLAGSSPAPPVGPLWT